MGRAFRLKHGTSIPQKDEYGICIQPTAQMKEATGSRKEVRFLRCAHSNGMNVGFPSEIR